MVIFYVFDKLLHKKSFITLNGYTYKLKTII